ncbi:hypothetical protein ACOZ4I_18315 (plasmid) [Haloarcula salina]|uniref:hypothetical protein n=1 Tax=Haloarcula salina TaxID=1429914 RepID=UPI003C6ED8D3
MSLAARLRPVSVPLGIGVLVAGMAVVVPPLALGELTARAYLLTAALIIISIASATPYAVVVGVGTLPLLYAGLGSYASPRRFPPRDERPDIWTGLWHVAAGGAYALAAAIVGAIAIGIDFTTASETAVPTVLQPSFFHLGGVVVAALYVCCQLWRYEGAVRERDRRAVAWTLVLGGLLAPAPAVALWVFGGGGL